MKTLKKLVYVLPVVFITSCGIQEIPRQMNEVDAAWAEVLNQYQRRSDLVGNLVETVKGAAKFEKETLESVVNARAQATQVKIEAKDLNDETLAKFRAAQGALSQSLGRLLAVSENYPELKANQNFRDLQVQLEGTENRIAVARMRYIETVKGFNNLVTVFPTSLTNSVFFHHSKKPQFTVEDEKAVAKPPEVKF